MGYSSLLYRERKIRKLYFGLKVVVMENTLKGIKYLDEHPEARAKD